MTTKWNAVWQKVTCRICKREFICTPIDDYFNFTNATDGIGECCLMKDAGLPDVKITTLEK